MLNMRFLVTSYLGKRDGNSDGVALFAHDLLVTRGKNLEMDSVEDDCSFRVCHLILRVWLWGSCKGQSSVRFCLSYT